MRNETKVQSTKNTRAAVKRRALPNCEKSLARGRCGTCHAETPESCSRTKALPESQQLTSECCYQAVIVKKQHQKPCMHDVIRLCIVDVV